MFISTLVWEKSIDKWTKAKNIEELKEIIVFTPPKFPFKILISNYIRCVTDYLSKSIRTIFNSFFKKSELFFKDYKKTLIFLLLLPFLIFLYTYISFAEECNGFKAIYYKHIYKSALDLPHDDPEYTHRSISKLCDVSKDCEANDNIIKLYRPSDNYFHNITTFYESIDMGDRFFEKKILSIRSFFGKNKDYEVYAHPRLKKISLGMGFPYIPTYYYDSILDFTINLSFGYYSIYKSIIVMLILS